MLLTEPGALLIFYFICLLRPGWSAIVNRTIDDSTGDSETGLRPIYLPSTAGVWKNETCTDCRINPDVKQAFNGTYTAATYNPTLKSTSITMQFNGTAIYVFFILANNAGDGITSLTDCNFTVDGSLPQNFKHIPDLTTTAIQFNTLVYSHTNLPNALHRLDIVTAGVNNNVYVNFDYAIYTHDDEFLVSSSTSSSSAASRLITSVQPSSTSRTPVVRSSSILHSPSVSAEPASSTSSIPIGAIVGGLVGGFIALAALISLLFFCYRRRLWNSRLQSHEPPPTSEIMKQSIRQPVAYHGSLNQQLENSTFSFPSQVPGRTRYSSQGVPPSFNPYLNHSSAESHMSPITPTIYNESDAYGGIVGGYDDANHSTHPNTLHTTSNAGLASMPPRRSGQGRTPTYVASNPVTGHQSSPLNSDLSFPMPMPTSQTMNSYHQDQICQARQQEIDERLRTVQQEMHDLNKDLKGGRLSIRKKRTVNRAHMDDEQEMSLSEMKEHIKLMQEEILFLRANQRSAWAQGLTDDPPPGYSPGSSSVPPAFRGLQSPPS